MATNTSSPPLSNLPPLADDQRAGSAFEKLHSQARYRLTAAVSITMLGALLTALVMPRGPVSSYDALLLMASAFVTGICVGYLVESRWALLFAPALHLIVFEIARLEEIGPTVDRIEIGTSFGLLALLLGRGVYAILALLPMTLGAAYGAGLARWQTREPAYPSPRSAALITRRVFTTLTTIGLVALAVRIARPSRVVPINDADGNPIDGSIAELAEVNLGGHEQWIQIRGASEHLPILLYLSGGPGQSDLSFSRVLLEELTRDFLIVGWDQRGNGKSYAALDPESLTLEQAIADTIELAGYLGNRFGQERIYLLGESWGSTLGVLAVQQAPDMFHAYIGSGQMVSQRVTDQIIYDDLLVWADANDDDDLARMLRQSGPPPYESLWMYGEVMAHYEKLTPDYDPPQPYLDRAEAGNVGPWGLFGSEYTAIDKVNVLRGLIDTFFVMYPQLQEIDFRTDVPRLEVPVYLLLGENELRGRLELAEEWFSILEAPEKQMYILENAGHAAAFEHADFLHRLLMEEIVPLADSTT